MKWFGEAEVLAKAGVPVRRRAWSSDGGMLYMSIVFTAGMGTTRAVAVLRNGATESVVQSTNFKTSEFQADDWEKA